MDNKKAMRIAQLKMQIKELEGELAKLQGVEEGMEEDMPQDMPKMPQGMM